MNKNRLDKNSQRIKKDIKAVPKVFKCPECNKRNALTITIGRQENRELKCAVIKCNNCSVYIKKSVKNISSTEQTIYESLIKKRQENSQQIIEQVRNRTEVEAQLQRIQPQPEQPQRMVTRSRSPIQSNNLQRDQNTDLRNNFFKMQWPRKIVSVTNMEDVTRQSTGTTTPIMERITSRTIYQHNRQEEECFSSLVESQPQPRNHGENTQINISYNAIMCDKNEESKFEQLDLGFQSNEQKDNKPQFYNAWDDKANEELSHIQQKMQRKYGRRNNFPWTAQVKQNLNLFGHQDFRSNQLEIINASMDKKDCIVLMPPSGGKSLPFQIMSTLTNGVTIVVMPLISLIQDNFNQMKNLGLKCLQLHSGFRGDTEKLLNMNQNEIYQERKRQKNQEPQELRNILAGKYQLVYICPERLGIKEEGEISEIQDNVSDQEVSEFINIMTQLNHKGMLDRIVLDEVHCVEKWGETFREAYSCSKLSQLKSKFPNVPILGQTASAKVETRLNLVNKLKYSPDHCLFVSPFNRENLIFEVKETKWGHDKDILENIRKNYKDQQGIIYCRTKIRCEQLQAFLQKSGIKCNFYHSRVKPEIRAIVQHNWMINKIQIIVATTALGMGIDKPNVRFVMHDQMPTCLESYINESGRAGRDGAPATCVMYHHEKDFDQWKQMLNHNHYKYNVAQEYREKEFENLAMMNTYGHNKTVCRRKFMLHYLGENVDTLQCNQSCDVCQNHN